MQKSNFSIDLEGGKRSRSHTVLESIQETENEDIEDDGNNINPFTDKPRLLIFWLPVGLFIALSSGND